MGVKFYLNCNQLLLFWLKGLSMREDWKNTKHRKYLKKIFTDSVKLWQFCKWSPMAKLSYRRRWRGCQNFCKKLVKKNSFNKEIKKNHTLRKKKKKKKPLKKKKKKKKKKK